MARFTASGAAIRRQRFRSSLWGGSKMGASRLILLERLCRSALIIALEGYLRAGANGYRGFKNPGKTEV